MVTFLLTAAHIEYGLFWPYPVSVKHKKQRDTARIKRKTGRWTERKATADSSSHNRWKVKEKIMWERKTEKQKE